MTETKSRLAIVGFADQAAFGDWLAGQAADAAGAWLKLAKKGKGGLAKAQAIDTALCHGWIDGQTNTYDDTHYLVRITPRRPRSRWSEVNRARALKLIQDGMMRATGLAQVESARSDGRWDAAYPPASTAGIPQDLKEALDQSPQAAAFFETLTGANRYAILHRVGAVKTATVRARKIATFVVMLERGETIYG